MSLNSPKKRFSLGLLISLNIHIALFLCFSPHFRTLSFSAPKIVYFQTEDNRQKVTPERQAYGAGSQQQKKIVESRTEQRNLHTGRIGLQEISVDKIEVKKKDRQASSLRQRRIRLRRNQQKKNIKPKAKNRIPTKDRIFAKKASVNREQKRQEKTLQERNLISYYQLISKQIKQKAFYPEQARRNLNQGLVYISFTVLSNGHLKEINIKISSGNDYLDKSALQSVREAGPFPPFPPQLKEKQLCLNIPISFEIE